MAQRPTKQLRRYLRDSTAPIPRTTLWRHRKKAALLASSQRGLAHSSSPPYPPSEPSSSSHLDPPRSSLSGLNSPCPSLSALDSPHPSLSDLDSPRPSLSDLDSPRPSLSDLNSPRPSLSDLDSPCPSLSSSDSLCPSLSDLDSPCPSLSDLDSPRSSLCGLNSPDSSLLDPESPLPLTSNIPQFSKDDKPELFEPLYQGARISLCGAICAIMHFCSIHKLSYAAIGDLLKLLLILCPAPNHLPTSFYRFQKFFHQFEPHRDSVRVCSQCLDLFTNCTCASHQHSSPAHLIHISVVKPLQTILSRNWEKLWQHFRGGQNVMHDVWDGPYRTVFKDRIALSLNTDGVPLFKSSSWSLWPVFLTILNLPASIRMKAENVLLAGLWYGPTKPPMKLLLEPVLNSLQQLSESGLTIKTLDGLKTVRTKLLMGVFDLPAKAMVLCAKQFNGQHGCSVCTHPGMRLTNGARVYLPTIYPDRTHSGVLAAGEAALQHNCAVDGVRGISALAPYLDLVLSIPVDYMHAVLEGVVRMLMNCWFTSSHHREPYYIGRAAAAIDEVLLQQCPPSEFSRPPRSIKKHLHYWKASELRNWLLYYSLPLLIHHIPSLYWHHYALLVCGLHILLKDGLAVAEIDAAEQMLWDFYSLLPDLYGEHRCTANAHLLSHLTKYVRLWGPLWTHSSFGYESKNGHIKNFIHNKSDVVKQLLFNLDVNLTLQHFLPILESSESDEVLEFLVSHTAMRSNMTQLGDHVYVIGKLQSVSLSGDEAAVLGLETGVVVKTFTRLYKDGVTYYCSSHHTSGGKRDNTMCKFIDPTTGCTNFGRIEFFVADPEQCVVLRGCHLTSDTLMERAGPPCRATLGVHRDADLLNSYIKPFSGYGQLISVPLQKLLGKAVLVKTTAVDFVISQPNIWEQH